MNMPFVFHIQYNKRVNLADFHLRGKLKRHSGWTCGELSKELYSGWTLRLTNQLFHAVTGIIVT